MTNGNAILKFKVSTMATSINEDAGFCSGDDYLELHSPTDSSEDSVEVKVSTITFNHKKRKLIQDSLVKESSHFTGPLKKRMCLKVKAEANDTSSPSLQGKTPFRPWSPSVSAASAISTSSLAPPSLVKPFSAYFRPPSPVQAEPVSLVIKRDERKPETDIRVPIHPEITKVTTAEADRMILNTNEQFPGLQPPPPQSGKKLETRREQRNYKNMTRERRIEANARERTRVHTISAAFDTLRQAIPSYSHNQKLSKLSVLRIACSYIMTLSTLAQDDDSPAEPTPSTSECVDLVSRTIQREGKLRKKKDDND